MIILINRIKTLSNFYGLLQDKRNIIFKPGIRIYSSVGFRTASNSTGKLIEAVLSYISVEEIVRNSRFLLSISTVTSPE
jgi:hypothetical protein